MACMCCIGMTSFADSCEQIWYAQMSMKYGAKICSNLFPDVVPQFIIYEHTEPRLSMQCILILLEKSVPSCSYMSFPLPTKKTYPDIPEHHRAWPVFTGSQRPVIL
ncbi:hypothetical protein PAXRUDRAFT_624459 [Paxillus rubicundulus Ve08.2h10]|uniref:Uncharacterized protein n=1 Tax=Paxillus rubicundulus Ve08.2h10 TaxID=930991 RepID=A0A0D0DVJ9_9AGAM|nr:hypothetical protein PAXRUDRAFT_624459 [Paxillus rubicundulus Ve08.2h10]